MTISQTWYLLTYLEEELQIYQVHYVKPFFLFLILTASLVFHKSCNLALSLGRDTPSSQITEGDDGRAAGEVRQLDLPPPNIPTKQSRSEIDDKFCKFEIKKLIEGKRMHCTKRHI